jgi:hypothetical protein
MWRQPVEKQPRVSETLEQSPHLASATPNTARLTATITAMPARRTTELHRHLANSTPEAGRAPPAHELSSPAPCPR